MKLTIFLIALKTEIVCKKFIFILNSMMKRNIEIKAKLRDRENVIRIAQQLSNSPGKTWKQIDTFFRTEKGLLKVRQFDKNTGELISYFRAEINGPKLSEYKKVPTNTPTELISAISNHLQIRGLVENTRTLFLVGQTRIHVDEVLNLGSYIELEVCLEEHQTVEEGQKIAHDLMNKLNIKEEELYTSAYIDLLSH